MGSVNFMKSFKRHSNFRTEGTEICLLPLQYLTPLHFEMGIVAAEITYSKNVFFWRICVKYYSFVITIPN